MGARCIYLGQALENSVGDSEVGHLCAINASAHGEFSHTGCMLDRAQRFACGHTNQTRFAPL